MIPLVLRVNAADAEEKRIATRRLEAEESKEKMREDATQLLERLQDRLKDGQKKMEEWPAKIAEKEKVLAEYGDQIAAAMKCVDETQAEILAITGANQYIKFDIETKDERGHTILMHTAQTNDATTASICLQMGADVHAVNAEGLTASDYSFFFKFEAVTQLILAVSLLFAYVCRYSQGQQLTTALYICIRFSRSMVAGCRRHKSKPGSFCRRFLP